MGSSRSLFPWGASNGDCEVKDGEWDLVVDHFAYAGLNEELCALAARKECHVHSLEDHADQCDGD